MRRSPLNVHSLFLLRLHFDDMTNVVYSARLAYDFLKKQKKTKKTDLLWFSN